MCALGEKESFLNCVCYVYFVDALIKQFKKKKENSCLINEIFFRCLVNSHLNKCFNHRLRYGVRATFSMCTPAVLPSTSVLGTGFLRPKIPEGVVIMVN